MKHSAPTFAESAISYFKNLSTTPPLPSEISIINPFNDSAVKSIVQIFYTKFYNDNNKRIYLIGINPGRFGGGITGIPFTDPVALENFCGITNSFTKTRELSSNFIYQLIGKMGGTEKFFSKFFLTALFPFALISNGNNFNYYDTKDLVNVLKDYIIQGLHLQAAFGTSTTAVCLGKKNAFFLSRINDELNLFKEIIVFEHPRYIMQYKRKKLDEYLEKYSNQLNSINTNH